MQEPHPATGEVLKRAASVVGKTDLYNMLLALYTLRQALDFGEFLHLLNIADTGGAITSSADLELVHQLIVDQEIA